ncbi:carbohydrate kinase family protein [Candidatus Poribacteria bacterium]|nr:carbohydrate kinase family protein [Candidatus Poribacteria bacterium]
MKIAVAGTVMRDEIHTVRGERRESFGGILYNVLALAAMTTGEDSIRPICALGADHLAAIREQYFSRYRQIDCRGMRENPDGTDENILRYRTSSDREETMTLHTRPLSEADLEPARDCDAVLINFINGRELSLEVLRQLRASSHAWLHLDIHNLGKRLDESSRLLPSGLPDWRDWLAQVDTVQANEWEIELLTGRKPESEIELNESALELLSIPNVKAAAITIGGRGAVVAHRMSQDAAPRLLRFPALTGFDAVDTTGCGDCFSSAFIVELLKSRNPARAGLVATVLSGLNARGGGLEALASDVSLDAAARHTFPDMTARIAQGWLGALAHG